MGTLNEQIVEAWERGDMRAVRVLEAVRDRIPEGEARIDAQRLAEVRLDVRRVEDALGETLTADADALVTVRLYELKSALSSPASYEECVSHLTRHAMMQRRLGCHDIDIRAAERLGTPGRWRLLTGHQVFSLLLVVAIVALVLDGLNGWLTAAFTNAMASLVLAGMVAGCVSLLVLGVRDTTRMLERRSAVRRR